MAFDATAVRSGEMLKITTCSDRKNASFSTLLWVHGPRTLGVVTGVGEREKKRVASKRQHYQQKLL